MKKGLPPGSPKFTYVVADDDMINAFALPGGHVVVMRGLLENAKPEELAGVLREMWADLDVWASRRERDPIN